MDGESRNPGSGRRRPATAVVDVWPLLVCETCEGEVDVLDEHAGQGVCRHCGIAFLLDVTPEDVRRVG